MSTKSDIVAAIDAAKHDLEEASAQLAVLPDLDWGTVRCAAHTLGNYLNITNACVDLLKMSLLDYPDPEVRNWLQALERTSELMVYISRQLTNASAASEVPLLSERVDLSRMAQRAVDFYQSMASGKNLHFLREWSGPVQVRADKIAVATVFDNLLSNALKYSPAGKQVRVRVKAEPGQVFCSVEDEGPGLTAAEQAKLFQKGVRLSSKPTGGEGSTGFGLYITKRVIERMGGSIGCETAPGQGCKFYFRLPADGT